MKGYLAQQPHPIGDEPLGPGDVGLDSSNPTETLANLVSTVIGLLTIVGAIYFMFMIISGAISIISSGGDENKYANARNRITTGAIGFVVVVAAVFIIGLIGIILDIPILNLGEMINNIQMQ